MIKALEVNRDERGMWSHPDFPRWDEGTSIECMSKWFSANKGNHYIDTLENSARDEVSEAWFDGELESCLDWTPHCSKNNAFLLSVHDTEDGPVAVYFVPN